MPRRVLRPIARGALSLALAGLAWTAVLLVFGGLDVRLLGHVVSSHDPMRPFLVTAVSLVVFMLMGGDDAVARPVAAVFGAVDVAIRSMTSATSRIAVTALVLTVIAVGFVDGARVAGGADSYGYISQAELWLSGRLEAPQPWARDVPWPDPLPTFTPLGYIYAHPPTFSVFGYAPPYDPWAVVPVYSPGLSILMAGAKALAGNGAIYLVVPICAGLMVLATYGIGRRLGSPLLGLVAAALVATSAPFIESAVAPMTDVPAAAGWALAWWGALGRSMRSAWGAALALAIVVLVRPDRVPLGAVIMLWLALRIWRDATVRRLQIQRGVVIAGGLAAGALAVAVLYWHWYGSPLESGYGSAAEPFALTYFLPNLRDYARVFAAAQTPLAFLGIAALFLPFRWLWPSVADRAAVPALALFALLVWVEFCFIHTQNAWVRFLLPSYPPIMVGLAAVLTAIGRGRPGGALVVVVPVCILGLIGITDVDRRGILRPAGIEAQYAGFAEQVRARTPDNSAVFALQHSGSIRYYAGRVTIRWDQMHTDWLDQSLAWLADRGVHTYAVLDDWEIPMLKARFAGQASLARFDTPVLVYQGTSLFDLERPANLPARTEYMVTPPRHPFGLAPAPPPTLVWRR